MIHTMLPVQYLQQAGARLVEPRKRLMLAVLMRVVDDCQGSTYRRAVAHGPSTDRRAVLEALAYVASTDRRWPFSFENLCDALGLDAGALRRGLQQAALRAAVSSDRRVWSAPGFDASGGHPVQGSCARRGAGTARD